ncbi:hypothetical protein OIU78_017953 [Salix suchowensis]|nr:hypothetical protein OIU78_017953 [Salix suchowensis]
MENMLSYSNAMLSCEDLWLENFGREEIGYEYAGGDMLEPREADIPVLFLVLVVLPLVAYILLGKWSESAKKRERISLLAQLAAEEACRVEVMATTCVIPPVSSSKEWNSSLC